jgi:hypothetical protein
MDDVTRLVAAIQKSGFPLQARVAHEISSRIKNGWEVTTSEFPWRDPDGEDQFIDLIASCEKMVLVIECRKAQARALLFLRTLGGMEKTGLTRTVTVWDIQQEQGAGKPFGQVIREVEAEPESYSTSICVSASPDGQRLLEQEARPVVLAADAVAGSGPQAARVALPVQAFIVPVIVTTAALYTLPFQPSAVALETGTLDFDLRQIEPIRWVRFHKILTARAPTPRTVLVVNTTALGDFLDEVSRGQHRGPWRSGEI